jgi:hypothetical protein
VAARYSPESGRHGPLTKIGAIDMTLPAIQQHLLDGIEGELRATEPRLVGMYAVFSRLTRGEALPRTEQIEARSGRPWSSWLTRLWAPDCSRPRRFISGVRVLLLLIPLALIGLMIALISATAPSARAACWGHQARVAHTTSQPAKSCLAAVRLRGSEVWLGPGRTRTAA